MLMVREIMTRDVFGVAPETTIREAMESLARRHITGAPVLSGGKVVGVVSAADLLSFVASLSGVPRSREEGEWEEWGEASDEDIDETSEEARGNSFWDWWEDAGASVSERLDKSEGPEWNALEEHDVSEAMTRGPLLTIPPTAPAETAARIMEERKVHRLLVTHGDGLVGIVTSSDIARAVAEGRLTKRVYIFGRHPIGSGG
jgi:CBS domain-containing protein